MQEKGFRIFGEEQPEIEEEMIVPEEEIESPAVQSSGTKSMFVAIFTFCVLGALLFFGYYNLNNRMARLEATGVNELKGLSNDLETRLAEITKQSAEQNAALKQHIETLGKQLKSSSSTLTNLEKDLTTTQKSTENTISSVASKIEATAGRINSFESGNRKAIDLLESKLTKLDRTLAETRSSLSGIEKVRESLKTMQSRFDSLSSQVKTLASNRVDAGNVDQQFHSLKKDLNRRLETTENQLQRDVYSLRNEINSLEAMIRSVKASSGYSPSRNSGAPSRSGDIIEQEIE